MRIHSIASAITVASLLFSAGAATGQMCEPEWITTGMRPGADHAVNAFAYWDDDGDGPNPPALYAAGRFLEIGGAPANKIARWDGHRWWPLGIGLGSDSNSEVHKLAVWDPDGDGPEPEKLYACGYLPTSAGSPGSHIACWDGATWTALGAGLSSTARSMTVWDPDGEGPERSWLVVAGSFNFAGGVPVGYVAAWDGTSWMPLGHGFSGFVTDVESWDPDGLGPQAPWLISSGYVPADGETPAGNVARWDGSRWVLLGVGLSSKVESLHMWDPDGPGPEGLQLLAAGWFTRSGSVSMKGVARWDGNAWHDMGYLGSAPLRRLWTWDPDGPGPGPEVLGASDASGSYAYDGASWSTLHPWVEMVQESAWINSAAYKHGGCAIVGTNSGSLAYLATLEGNDWKPFGTGLLTPLLDITTWRSPTRSDRRALWGTGAARLYTWEDNQWRQHPFPLGASNPASKLATFRGNDGIERLILGGSFASAQGITLNAIAAWDGTSLSPLGTGLRRSGSPGSVHRLFAWTPSPSEPVRLYAHGDFNNADGQIALRIASWDGATWRPLGSGVSGWLDDITEWDPDGDGPLTSRLVVVGNQGNAGGLPNTLHWAAWNGVAWESLGPSPARFWLTAATSWDPDDDGPLHPLLAIGGEIEGTSSYLGLWDGSDVMVPGDGIAGYVSDMVSWDPDAEGPLSSRLYAAVGGTGNPKTIQSWDGNTWNIVAVLNGGFASQLMPIDFDGDGPLPPYLAVRGSFGLVNDMPSSYLALLRPAAPPILTSHPLSVLLCSGDSAHLSVETDPASSHHFQWQRLSGDTWADLSDGPAPGGAIIDGANTPTLGIAYASSDHTGQYQCVVTNACGTAASSRATLTVHDCCPADYNTDMTADILDFLDFFQDFSDCENAPSPCGSHGDPDLNGDTVTDILDFLEFMQAFSDGCP